MARILVVDNNPEYLTTLGEILSHAGHVVKTTANESAALSSLAEEDFDFAVVDVRLHEEGEDDESGIALAIAIRCLKATVRVILLTRYMRTNQLQRAVRYGGVVDFIGKTDDIGDDILKIIKSATPIDAASAGSQAGDRLATASKPQLQTLLAQDWLQLSLTNYQPLFARSHGSYSCSVRSARNLRVDSLRYARLAENARQVRAQLRFNVRDIGERLWRDLFEDHQEILSTYLEARARSRILSLRFECPQDYLSLPIEFMFTKDPEDYLVLQHPVSRFMLGTTPRRKPISRSELALGKELRVLIIASNTEPPPIEGVEDEARQVASYLTNQTLYPVKVNLIPTKEATHHRVRAEVGSPDYDIIHYAGHGRFNILSPEESALYFWTERNRSGSVVAMQSPELTMLLEQSEAKLVYLSCCQGAHLGPTSALLDDDFLGLAHAVVHAGVPSVLGYRWPVSDTGAPKLAKAFYEALLELGSPDYALWQARRELAAADRNDPTWMSPILIHQV